MKSAAVVFAVVLLASAMLSAQSNAVPLVNNPLVPSSALPGSASFTLTVNGTGFVAGSTVDWNGLALQTTFMSGSQLTATVPAANIATAGTASVTVISPAPGGGMSNVAWFAVRKPFPAAAFGDQLDSPAGAGASVPLVADVNGDGKSDVVAIAADDSAVSVLLGNGDGSFALAVEYPIGSEPAGLVLGDFNADGIIDVAVSDFSGFVSVLLGKGDGTFQLRKDSPSGDLGLSLIAADFDANGKLDLGVVLEGGQVAILLGNGDGTFQLPVSYPAGSGRDSGIAVGDFNGDGKLDLVVAVYTDTAVTVLLGNGDGTFQHDVEYPTASGPEFLVAGDFNGDSVLDLAVRTTAGKVSILLGNGDGTFLQHKDYPSQMSLNSTDVRLSASDLNGDGALEIVTPSFDATAVFVGNGVGGFIGSGYFASPKLPSGVAIGDLNEDGLPDLVIGNPFANSITVLPQITSVLSETLTYFGSVKLGKSKTRQVTLMNYGDNVLSIDLIGVQGDDASVFSETNTCGSGVQPGASCKIAITFTPQRPRQYTMARVAIRDSATRLSQKIMLEGMGLK